MRSSAALASVAFGVVVLLACGGSTDGSSSSGSSSGGSSSSGSSGSDTPPGDETPGSSSGSASGAPRTAAECFKDLTGAVPAPNYDQFGPKIASSCAGTNHQDIEGVEHLVFLGDSITVGTPPTSSSDFYRKRLERELIKKFPSLTTASCAEWGARMDDLASQIEQCFPGGVENKKTLVVMTIGGNDLNAWADDKLSAAAASAKADEAVGHLRAAIDWLRSPAHFPNGSYVVTANVYDFTDTSANLESCPTASLAGLSGTWTEGISAVAHLEEQIMKAAVETKTDMIFLMEHFCGHGFRRDDPSLQCYRGPGAELWFDLTCIHPNPTGHGEIAKLFQQVIEGTE